MDFIAIHAASKPDAACLIEGERAWTLGFGPPPVITWPDGQAISASASSSRFAACLSP